MNVTERILALRKVMKTAGVAAYIVPGTDPHAGEYIANHWKERKWISGFNGSAGTAVVTLEKAGLWTDSRYFLQGAEQLKGTEIELMKEGLPETLAIIPWLTTVLNRGDKVAVNPKMFSLNSYAAMKAELAISGIELISADLIDEVWSDRPALPMEKFFVFDETYSGKTVVEKLNAIRTELKKAHSEVFVTSALDDIAWMFNIRGKDVDYNPVTIAFALVNETSATLFVDSKKCTPEAVDYLAKNGVSVADYNSIYAALGEIPIDKAVLVDGNKLNQLLFEAIPAKCPKRIQMSPAFRLKSIKNSVEIAGTDRAMIKDGVALTRFFRWLEGAVGNEKLTELSITEKLHNFRAEQENFVGESFNTICGYAGHGAIVHYAANEETDAEVFANGLLLIDSGGQYLDGTTDITRTVSLGNPTKAEKTDYTLVLKGHIQIATAKYPQGTRGSQIDILARKAMWDRGINYGHGTGHGVGHFLNVHEGPQNIRMDENPTTLEVGMITSNEPGIYRANEHGIRIENLVLTVPAEKTEFAQFYKFQTLTYCYIETSIVEKELLTDAEVEWLNAYQAMVYSTLSPHLTADEKEWLKAKCQAI